MPVSSASFLHIEQNEYANTAGSGGWEHRYNFEIGCGHGSVLANQIVTFCDASYFLTHKHTQEATN